MPQPARAEDRRGATLTYLRRNAFQYQPEGGRDHEDFEIGPVRSGRRSNIRGERLLALAGRGFRLVPAGPLEMAAEVGGLAVGCEAGRV